MNRDITLIPPSALSPRERNREAVRRAVARSGGEFMTVGPVGPAQCGGCGEYVGPAGGAGAVWVEGADGGRVMVQVCSRCADEFTSPPPPQAEDGPPPGWVDHPLRADLPPLPPRVRRLPVAANGYPVPWFVAWINGQPEFRTADSRKFQQAIAQKRCWVCGEPTGANVAFLIGPMCVVNRTTAEPPSHRECAEFSATACPFLTKPHMTRREANMPAGTCAPAGEAIKRNPGVVCLWVTRSFSLFPDGRGGWLINIGDPAEHAWYAEGRTATRAEVVASIDSGLPLLQKLCTTEADNAHLYQLLAAAKKLLPPHAPDPVEQARLTDDGCHIDPPAG